MYFCVPVKIPGIILTFYILLLAAMPCRDARECESKAKMEQANHNGNDDEKENCTPFCICACCPTQIYITDLAVDNFTPLIFSEFSCEINSEIRSFISHSIWQPPRTV